MPTRALRVWLGWYSDRSFGVYPWARTTAAACCASWGALWPWSNWGSGAVCVWLGVVLWPAEPAPLAPVLEGAAVLVVVLELGPGDPLSPAPPWLSAVTVLVEPPQPVAAVPISAASASGAMKRPFIAEMVLPAPGALRSCNPPPRRGPAARAARAVRRAGYAGHGYYHPWMAGTAGQPGPAKKGDQQAKRRSRGELSRTIAIVVLAIAVILFAVKNLKQVKVNWVVGSGSAPLIIVILITLLVGIVISHLGGRLSRRKRPKDGG